MFDVPLYTAHVSLDHRELTHAVGLPVSRFPPDQPQHPIGCQTTVPNRTAEEPKAPIEIPPVAVTESQCPGDTVAEAGGHLLISVEKEDPPLSYRRVTERPVPLAGPVVEWAAEDDGARRGADLLSLVRAPAVYHEHGNAPSASGRYGVLKVSCLVLGEEHDREVIER
jgi:hypothetical protein